MATMVPRYTAEEVRRFPDDGLRYEEERLYGAPSLAIEIIAYSSKRTDRLQQRDLYMTEDVEEYWIVDPGLRRVERWPKGAAEPKLVTGRLGSVTSVMRRKDAVLGPRLPACDPTAPRALRTRLRDP